MSDPTLAPARAEYLSFRLGDGEYGIGIRQVREIRSYEPPVGLVKAPAALRGVIDLRGVITPLVDLRLAFGQAAPCTAQTGVIVLKVGARTVGIVVDAVADVLALDARQIHPAPRLSFPGFDGSFITGIATARERTLILMDIARLLDNPALGLAGGLCATH